MTQAERLIKALRCRWFTTGELLDLHISTSPWKRLQESGYKHLRKGEVLKKVKGCDGLLRMKVVRSL